MSTDLRTQANSFHTYATQGEVIELDEVVAPLRRVKASGAVRR